MKNWHRFLIFMLLFCLIWIIIFSILRVEINPIRLFYKEPKNSLDVIYYGASTVYFQFNTTLAYKEYGFTTGMFSAASQPHSIVENLIEEVYKYQQPKINIIDISDMYRNVETFKEEYYRKTIDNIRFSKEKVEMINKAKKYVYGIKPYEFYFDFLKYHNSWKYLSIRNFYIEEYYKGFYFSSKSFRKMPQFVDENWTREEEMLPDETKEILSNLIKYIKDNHIPVIFIVSYKDYYNQIPKMNSVIEMIENSELKIINFNTLKDIDLDCTTDMYDSGHLNIFGTTKYTEYMSKYLKEHYDLPDHRGDKKYESWDKEYERFIKKYKNICGSDFEDLLTYNK